jgi:phenylalanine-4-hydroxylase
MKEMVQDYSKYTAEDTEVWNILAKRQIENLQDKAHPEYLRCLNLLKDELNADEVPDFDKLNAKLMEAHGWSITVVPGLIDVNDFFELLNRKKFSASTWLRKKSQLDYLEEPDMFHDVFGHIPLLMNKDFTDFAQKMGNLGVRYRNNQQVVKQLQRLYWFTIEFGLIDYEGETKLYGAGIMSSSGESDHIFNDDVEIRPYDIFSIIKQPFVTSEIQWIYYQIESFKQLFDSINELESYLNRIN